MFCVWCHELAASSTGPPLLTHFSVTFGLECQLYTLKQTATVPRMNTNSVTDRLSVTHILTFGKCYNIVSECPLVTGHL